MMVEPVARGHIEVIPSETSRTVGGEIERLAIGRQIRGSFVVGSIDRWSEIYRCGPRVMSGRPRRDPKINSAKPARAVRCQEYFQPITPDGGMRIRLRAIEFRDQDGYIVTAPVSGST